MHSAAKRLSTGMVTATRILMLAVALLSTGTHAQSVSLLVQSSPLAGFNYHGAPAVFAHMRVGDELTLWREQDNLHDANAVGVLWRDSKLGYVPRSQNAALAWAMDRGEPVLARISRLQSHRNPRLRVEFEVFIR